MKQPLKIIAVVLILFLIAQPCFANPIMPINPVMANPAMVINPLNNTFIPGSKIQDRTITVNNLNQYTQVNTNTLNYDPNGNLTGNAGWAYSYDYENRLIGTTNAITTAAYAYDVMGRRISKTVGGVTTNFIYDGDNLLAECDSTGTLLRKYVYGSGIDEPVTMISGANAYYYNRDALGSISELTDNTGAIVEKYQYDSFGKTIITDVSNNVLTQSTIGNRFGFTGRELDIETGLYFYRNRYYSPELGRFLQTDSAGYYDSMNLYNYVNGNPLRFVDPFGLGTTENKSLLEKAGDLLSYASLGMNGVGAGMALSSFTFGPEMLIPAETISVGAFVVDLVAATAYGADYFVNGSRRSGVKAIFSGASAFFDLALSSSVAVKPAMYGSRFFSKATGRYVSQSIGATAAARPFVLGGAADTAFIVGGEQIPVKNDK